MDGEFLGLKLRLSLKDGSIVTGTVASIASAADQLTLSNALLVPRGFDERDRSSGMALPQLSIVAGNIANVEIVPGERNNEGSARNTKGPKNPKNTKRETTSTSNPVGIIGSGIRKDTPRPKGSSSAIESNGASPQPTSFSSSPAALSRTFSASHALASVPVEEFDFVGNLQRFNKAAVFADIRESDLVKPEERLVSINVQQRKLGVKEPVLDEKRPRTTASQTVTDASLPKRSIDPIATKLMNINISTRPPAPIIVENGTDTEPEPEEAAANSPVQLLPQLFLTAEQGNRIDELMRESGLDVESTVISAASINLAHHLLAEWKTHSSLHTLVLICGNGKEAAVALSALRHLINHNRCPQIQNVSVLFAIGGAGRKIELPAPIKVLRKLLMTATGTKVNFITSLVDLFQIEPSPKKQPSASVAVIEALGLAGMRDLSSQATLGIGKWLTAHATAHTGLVYSIGGASAALTTQPSGPSHIKFVSIGMPLESMGSVLSRQHSSTTLLLLDSGIPSVFYAQVAPHIDAEFIFSAGFVVEIDL